MDRLTTVRKLIELLLADMPECAAQAARFAPDEDSQRQLLRGLMNMRSPAREPNDEYYALQDALLQDELAQKNLTEVAALEPVKLHPAIRHYHGDITAIRADALVNSANQNLLGCFIAGHACTDNCIHSAAGLQLRYACARAAEQLKNQNTEGRAVITKAYNLPARYVIHAVPPGIRWQMNAECEAGLKSCYTESLRLAREHGVKSLVFCCLGTGEAGFPHSRAAHIAVETVKADLEAHGGDLTVVFDTFRDMDKEIYLKLLYPKDSGEEDELRPFFNLSLL